MIANLLAFILAAGLEIAGCFVFWQWLRGGRSALLALVGTMSLIGFAVMLTRVDALFAGRAYALTAGSTSPLRWAGSMRLRGSAHQRQT